MGPPSAQGRWSLLPERADATRRLHAVTQQLLKRHGIVTRDVVAAERIAGGFAAVYPVLTATEDAGRCRRGYFVEGLGGAQFSLPGAVERLRSMGEPEPSPKAIVLAATDPANPYGAALAWPSERGTGPRAGRKAGAVVALVDGRLAVFLEKGGRSMIVADDELLTPAFEAIANAARSRMIDEPHIERVDGASLALEGRVAAALKDAGFVPTPRGLRLPVR